VTFHQVQPVDASTLAMLISEVESRQSVASGEVSYNAVHTVFVHATVPVWRSSERMGDCLHYLRLSIASEVQMTISLDDVQHLADQLSPLDQVKLIEHLSRQIAPVLVAPPQATSALGTEDAWAKLAQLREELAVLPANRLASEQLSADRGERQAMLEGSGRVHA
jgi:hypothetical protein